ncbi:hypothetical protein MMC06_001453 [Schaereria dolodes]|nr:hypothetical protein [Schaereria dolodes]
MPIHHLYTYCCRSDSGNRSLYLNGRSLWQLGTSEFHLIGIPFYTFCDSTFDPVVKDYSCNTTWLALAQSTHLTKVNVFIVGSNAQGPPVVVCDHAISRENGIRNDWVPLAFLSGWQQGESSIGTVIGTSPGGTRIAAATWTKLLVWSIDPQLISAEFPCYFPIEDYNVTKEIGRLRPVQLPSRGVVHSMQWTDETILYAMTDHGLVKWDVGSTSRGIERACSLEPMIECLIEHASPKLADLKLLKVSRPWS